MLILPYQSSLFLFTLTRYENQNSALVEIQEKVFNFTEFKLRRNSSNVQIFDQMFGDKQKAGLDRCT